MTTKNKYYELYLAVENDIYEKGDILTYGSVDWIVTKTYKRIWFRVLLCNLGILDKYFLNNKNRSIVKIKRLRND